MNTPAASWWKPRGGRVRLVGGLWLLVSFVLGTVYRSNLKAMLILPKLHVPFNSFEQLVDTDIPVHVIKGSIFANDVKVNI